MGKQGSCRNIPYVQILTDFYHILSFLQHPFGGTKTFLYLCAHKLE